MKNPGSLFYKRCTVGSHGAIDDAVRHEKLTGKRYKYYCSPVPSISPPELTEYEVEGFTLLLY